MPILAAALTILFFAVLLAALRLWDVLDKAIHRELNQSQRFALRAVSRPKLRDWGRSDFGGVDS